MIDTRRAVQLLNMLVGEDRHGRMTLMPVDRQREAVITNARIRWSPEENLWVVEGELPDVELLDDVSEIDGDGASNRMREDFLDDLSLSGGA